MAFPYSLSAKVEDTNKTYLTMFVFYVAKAVHHELASGVTSASFLDVFRRFISTRGLCKKVFSDNGTHFVGANSELYMLYLLLQKYNLQGTNNDMCSPHVIIWTFMLADSPHFGGMYETSVMSSKLSSSIYWLRKSYLLRAPHSHQTSRSNFELPPFDSFGTLVAIPETPDPYKPNINYLKRWELVNQIYKIVWSQWSTDYLQQLHHR